MTKEQADKIRRIVSERGWEAVRNHPELSVVWAKCLNDSANYVNAVIDR